MDSTYQFFLSSFMPTSLNSASLVMLPKRLSADSINLFRPIVCLNTQYKLILKLLSSRLKIVLPTLILPNQTALLKID